MDLYFGPYNKSIVVKDWVDYSEGEEEQHTVEEISNQHRHTQYTNWQAIQSKHDNCIGYSILDLISKRHILVSIQWISVEINKCSVFLKASFSNSKFSVLSIKYNLITIALYYNSRKRVLISNKFT